MGAAALRERAREFREFFANGLTQHFRAEEEVLRTKKFLDSIVENIPLMIFAKDAQELRFLLWNKTNEELTGHSKEAAIGKTDFDLVPREQAEFFQLIT